jgi:amidase/aspartyl-tRNA(Asn)/glutamyl-tRNA(Gln) amidotransferase subunit A
MGLNGPVGLVSLAGMLRAGEMSAMELVTACLERIDELASLNAVVALRAEEAIGDARHSDAARSAGKAARPLEGVPFLVKDNEAVAGMRTTYGSLLCADAPTEPADGVSTTRLRKLGGIPIGKTNLPEFAFDGFTANRLFGATLNPWEPAYSPGGSSGGSAVAIATGMAPIATATDVGGSARIPAALCGLVGLKLTAGGLALDPQLPSPRLNGHGLMGISVEDVAFQLSALTGRAWPWNPQADGDVRGVQVIAAPSMRPLRDKSPVATEWRAALVRLQDLNVQIREIEPEEVVGPDHDPDDWFRLVGVDQLNALPADALGMRADLLDPLFRSQMSAATKVSQRQRDNAVRRVAACRAHVDRLLAQDRLLVTPTLNVPGWSPWGALGDRPPGLPGWVYNTEPQNLGGHPAISVPAGLSTNGVPFGIQVTGARGSDWRLLAFAARWAEANPFRPFALPITSAG